MPDLSVILPFCDEEDVLSSAIQSVIEQTFENFELLLINNGNNPISKEIANDWMQKDKRITVSDESRKGIVYALNTGIALSKGGFIARMDADDISKPDRLKMQIEYLKENQNIGVVASSVEYITKLNQSEGMEHFVNWNNSLLSPSEISLNRFIETPIIHPSVMFRRELIKQYGGYEHGHFPEDYELWLRWLHNGVHFAKLPETLLEWHDHPARLTRNDPRYSRKAFYDMKSAYLVKYLTQHNPFHPHVVVFGAGRTARRRARTLEKMNITIDFFVDIKPGRKKNIKYFKDVPPAGNHFILSYIAKRGAREEVRSFLADHNYKEGKDFLVIG